ncbi:WbqC family protein [Chryseobacterium manosquense]|uniref:WbqC family protein n=1 Tax=Chryseobacterium manosquense TaxID=2754694 RepID=A0A7H1DX90_9FLAO|nr:WbqC family protein [Chryseobacterium manosquense]QNS41598.1 WbqC family protein [Chryseobacterium manosquense]
MKVLLPLFYLPPISWFSVFLQHDAEVTLEQFENFPKQTYRNRTVIYGANGKLALIIPVLHNGKKTINEIEVSQRENWQKLHWKSIKNAYQSSPYFEFYEDQLAQIFTFETQSLFQFNLNALQIIQKILKTEKAYSLNEEFTKTPAEVDFRNKFSAKKESEFEMEEYYQTFSDKLGFEKDISILDLICNKGPESLTYLRNVQSK